MLRRRWLKRELECLYWRNCPMCFNITKRLLRTKRTVDVLDHIKLQQWLGKFSSVLYHVLL